MKNLLRYLRWSEFLLEIAYATIANELVYFLFELNRRFYS
jgi:hypothetical protein